MARFLVQFRRVEIYDADVQAEDRHAALKAAYEDLHANAGTGEGPDWETDSVSLMTKTEDGHDVEEEEWLVEGCCEVCDRDLLTDDDYDQDEEGVRVCRPCGGLQDDQPDAPKAGV